MVNKISNYITIANKIISVIRQICFYPKDNEIKYHNQIKTILIFLNIVVLVGIPFIIAYFPYLPFISPYTNDISLENSLNDKAPNNSFLQSNFSTKEINGFTNIEFDLNYLFNFSSKDLSYIPLNSSKSLNNFLEGTMRISFSKFQESNLLTETFNETLLGKNSSIENVTIQWATTPIKSSAWFPFEVYSLQLQIQNLNFNNFKNVKTRFDIENRESTWEIKYENIDIHSSYIVWNFSLRKSDITIFLFFIPVVLGTIVSYAMFFLPKKKNENGQQLIAYSIALFFIYAFLITPVPILPLFLLLMILISGFLFILSSEVEEHLNNKNKDYNKGDMTTYRLDMGILMILTPINWWITSNYINSIITEFTSGIVKLLLFIAYSALFSWIDSKISKKLKLFKNRILHILFFIILCLIAGVLIIRFGSILLPNLESLGETAGFIIPILLFSTIAWYYNILVIKERKSWRLYNKNIDSLMSQLKNADSIDTKISLLEKINSELDKLEKLKNINFDNNIFESLKTSYDSLREELSIYKSDLIMLKISKSIEKNIKDFIDLKKVDNSLEKRKLLLKKIIEELNDLQKSNNNNKQNLENLKVIVSFMEEIISDEENTIVIRKNFKIIEDKFKAIPLDTENNTLPMTTLVELQKLIPDLKKFHLFLEKYPEYKLLSEQIFSIIQKITAIQINS